MLRGLGVRGCGTETGSVIINQPARNDAATNVAPKGTVSDRRFTLATEFATRNMAVATAIALTLAGRVEFAVFATTYFLTEIPLMLCAIVVYRRWRHII